MKSQYRGHRFPDETISHAVWLYHRFTMSFRDVEDLLAEQTTASSNPAAPPHNCFAFSTLLPSLSLQKTES